MLVWVCVFWRENGGRFVIRAYKERERGFMGKSVKGAMKAEVCVCVFSERRKEKKELLVRWEKLCFVCLWGLLFKILFVGPTNKYY